MITPHCKICGKKFRTYPCYIKKGGGIFCSHRCFAKWASSHQRGENSPAWKGGGVKKICGICGKEFWVKAAEIKYGRGKYCSVKCKGIGERGENNGNWKGGITPTLQRIRNSIELHLWREAVFARDNWTCQKCWDNKGGNLNAHHIKTFANYPELRVAIDNGITFCKDCHKEFHRLFGKKDNDEGQIKKFLA